MARASKKKSGGKQSPGKDASQKGRTAVSGGASGGGVVAQTSGFFHESVEELKKVTVPTRQETIQATLVTLIIMVFVAMCLFFMDFLFGSLMRSVLS